MHLIYSINQALVKSQLIGKDPGAGKYWGQEERGDCRGCDGWMASPTQWTWVGANSGREWRTAMSGMLQSMGSQRIRQNLVTDQQKSLLTFCLNVLSIIECGLGSLRCGRTGVSFSLQFCWCSLYTCRRSVTGWIYLWTFYFCVRLNICHNILLVPLISS